MTEGGFGRDGSLQKLSNSGVDLDKGADPRISGGYSAMVEVCVILVY